MLLEYPVICHRPECTQLAEFKIAAQWSDGTTHELKTYSLSCAACLPMLLADACVKQKNCRRIAGETHGTPGVYERQNPRNPRQLVHRPDLEVAGFPLPMAPK